MNSSTKTEAYLQKFLQKFQHLKIQLEDIKEATNNFKDKHIGVGGFGKVYEGKVSHSDGQSVVAIKRHDRNGIQGVPEFLKEITMLSDYKHENIISLKGYCCEGGEKILVYELASRGSLDRYLNSPDLTWGQRLKICLDVAKGINYLHDPRETRRRLIHCDVKSGNILLDEQWNAKVSDFGLSTVGSANEQHSVIVTLAAGTRGYIDPLYWMTHTLTKESDVYSFGVVLFEVLCGRLCYTLDSKGYKDILVHTWIKSYEQKKLNDIIFKMTCQPMQPMHTWIKSYKMTCQPMQPMQPMQPIVLKIFSDIAYKCLKEAPEDRPKMAEVVTELGRALFLHELLPELDFKVELNEDKLMDLLSKGVLLNHGKTWVSLNKKSERCEMTSIVECLGSEARRHRFSSDYNSRFAMGTYTLFYFDNKITNVRTQFLSPGITYKVFLVFQFESEKKTKREPIFLKHKLQGKRESSISDMAYEREDGWWMCELYQFTCHHRIIHHQILLEEFSYHMSNIHLEGFEFQPSDKLEHIDEKQQISDSDSYANWEEKMPTDFEDIIKSS